MWGGGGGGDGGDGGGDAGGAAAYVHATAVPVTPGHMYTVTVATGGTGGSINGAGTGGTGFHTGGNGAVSAYCGGPGCLNRKSASLSGSSAGVKLPCGVAAGRSRLDLGCGRQEPREVALCCRRRCSGRSIAVLRRRRHRRADRLPRT